MKVLHLYRDLLHDGGVPYEARSLAAAQADLGHDVVVYCLEGSPAHRDALFRSVRVVSADKSAFGTRQLRALLRGERFDLAHLYSLWIPLHNLWAAELYRAGVPYVLSPHGALNAHTMRVRFGGKRNSLVNYTLKQLYRKTLDSLLLHRAAGFHALSPYEAGLAQRAWTGKPVVVAPNGVDPELRQPEGSPATNRDCITFLYLGRLDIYQKGLDLILEACRTLRQIRPGVRFQLVCAGPSVGPSRQQLETRVRTLGLLDVVNFPGPVYGGAKASALLDAHYFLHASRFEGLARSAREAVAYGLPVVASRESNFGDWVEQWQMGWSVDCDKASVLGALIQAVDAFPTPAYARLAANARRFARVSSWRSVAKTVIEGYDRILSGQGSLSFSHAGANG